MRIYIWQFVVNVKHLSEPVNSFQRKVSPPFNLHLVLREKERGESFLSVQADEQKMTDIVVRCLAADFFLFNKPNNTRI